MYNYFLPTKVVFGNDTIFELEGILKNYVNQKLLIITDPGIISVGLLESVEKIVSAANIEYKVFSDVEPNPKTKTIREGLKFAQEFGANFVIGFGGGSSIDTAKAVAIMLNNDGDILQYEGVGNVPNDAVDLIAIPTTAGTGSEVTASTVITDEATLFKVAIISEKIFPKIAIVDPKLTIGCPKPITSSTAIDALTHAIESYLSKQANGIVASMALKAITLINENIESVYKDGSNIEGRKNLLEAATLAGISFSQTRLGNVHAISQAFGGVFDVPHGFANAVLLPYVLEFNLPAAIEKYCEIAKALNVFEANCTDVENAKKVVERIKELNKNLDIPKTTKELGINLDSIETLIEDSMRSGNILVNPRETTADDVKTIIEASFYGYELEESV